MASYQSGDDVGGGGGSSSSSGCKLWERPWSTSEMRHNAHNWNLAADAGLLKHLQQLSQTVLSRTHSTEKLLGSLAEEINTATTEISNINNEFLCLANTQFVENRVYDDDDKDSPAEAPQHEKKSKEETEAAMLKRVREALSISVAVLDTMFEPIEIQASDSDGETEENSSSAKTLLLEPHNPYMHRPLPHLIGSEAFMNDDRIGLGDSPSDGEERPIGEALPNMDVSSDSDFDTAVPRNKRGRDTYSSSDSESDFYDDQSKEGQKKLKTKSSSALRTTLNPPGLDSAYSEDKPVTVSGAVGKESTFAEQLAAKLGGVAAAAAAASASNAGKTGQRTSGDSAGSKSKSVSDIIFGGPDEDEDDDALFSGNSGLFSGRTRLFDDLDEASNSLWGPGPQKKNVKGDEVVPSITTTKPTPKSKKENAIDDFLGSHPTSDDDVDGLFSRKPAKPAAFQKTGTYNAECKPSQLSSDEIGKKLPGTSGGSGVATSTPELHVGGRRNSMFANHDNSGALFENVIGDISNIKEPKQDGNQDQSSKSGEPGGSSAPKKKPAGGVLMFGPSNVLGGLKEKLPQQPPSTSSSSSASDDGKGDEEPGTMSTPSDGLLNVTYVSSGPSSGLGCTAVTPDSYAGASNLSFEHLISSTRNRLPTEDDGYRTKNLFPSESSNAVGGDMFSTSSVKANSKVSTSAGGLFADIDDDDDDDLFSIPRSKSSSAPTTKPSNLIITNSAAEEESDLFVEKSSETSNTSGSKNQKSSLSYETLAEPFKPQTVIARDNDTIAKDCQSASETPSATETPKINLFSPVPPPMKTEEKPKKTLSLFDDSDSGEDELLFSSASSAGSRRSQASGDLLSTSAASSIEKKSLSKKGLFDDDDALFGRTQGAPDVDIFSETSKEKPHLSSTSKLSSLSNNASVWNSGPSLSSKEVSTKSDANSTSISSITGKPPNALDDLFGDTADDDLFSPAKMGTLQNKLVISSTESESDLFTTSTVGRRSDVQTVVRQSIREADKQVKSSQNASEKSSASCDNDLFSVDSKCEVSDESQAKVPSSDPSGIILQQSQSHDLVVKEKENHISSLDSKKSNPFPDNSETTSEKPLLPSASTKPKKPEPPRTLDIRKTTDPSLGDFNDNDEDDDDDLFKVVVPKRSLEIPQKLATDKFDPPTSKKPLDPKPAPAAKQVSDVTPSVKPNDLLSRDMAKRIFGEDLNTSDVGGESANKVKDSVKGLSKLPGLNIDPLALLPGAKPPSKQSSPGFASRQEHSNTEVTNLTTQRREDKTSQAVGFDQPIVNNATLPSAQKDRVKHVVKRRPPSSKARREAARASQNLDPSDTDTDYSPLSSERAPVSLLPKPDSRTLFTPAGNVLSPSTDEDDIFGIPHDLPPEYGNQNMSVSDIFAGAPLLSPALPSSQAVISSGNDAKLFPVDVASQPTQVINHCAPLSVNLEKHEDIFTSPLVASVLKEDSPLKPIDSLSEQKRPLAEEKRPTGKSAGLPSELFPASGSHLDSFTKLESPSSSSQDLLKSEEEEVSSSVCVQEKPVSISSSDTLVGDEPKLTEGCPPQITEVVPNDELDDFFENPASSLFNTSKQSTGIMDVPRKTLPTSVTPVDVDPLNKTEPTLPPVEGLIDEENGNEDHSSLFAFVKKKADINTQTSKLLFSKAPPLPTKQDNTSKPKMGILGDGDDGDLFASSKNVVKNDGKKSVVGKMWHLSDDDDDDDLFLSGTKSVKITSTHNSSKNPISVQDPKTKSKQSPVVSEAQKSKPTPAAASAVRSGLFGEEDDDNDDLFSKPSTLKTKLKTSASNATSLFDDNDDDLFGSSSISDHQKKVQRKAASGVGKTASSSTARNHQVTAATKLKSENVFDDPLMALQKNKQGHES